MQPTRKNDAYFTYNTEQTLTIPFQKLASLWVSNENGKG